MWRSGNQPIIRRLLARTTPLRALAPLASIWRPFAARRRAVGIGATCALAAGGALLVLPIAAARALDAAEARDASGVTRWVAVFAAAVLVEATLRFVARSLLVGASRDAEAALKDGLQAHLLRLPVRWFDRHSPGEVVSRMTQDVEAMRFTTGPALLYGLQALAVVPGGLAVLLQTTPTLGLVAFGFFAALSVYLFRLAPALRRESTAVQAALGEVGARAGEAFAAIRFVQAAHRIDAETRSMARAAENVRGQSVALARVQARMDLGIHATTECVLFAGLCLGGLAVANGTSSPGDLLGFYALLGVQLAPLLALGFVLGGLPRALGAAVRVQEVLDAPLDPGATDGERVPDTASGARPTPPRIEVRHLTFRHAGSSALTLEDVSFVLEPGQSLGICGPVGSGKSALVDLLLRLEEPPPDTIFFDGIDVVTIAPGATGTPRVARSEPLASDARSMICPTAWIRASASGA